MKENKIEALRSEEKTRWRRRTGEKRDRCEIKRQREGKKAELELALGQKILKAFGKVTNVCMLMC